MGRDVSAIIIAITSTLFFQIVALSSRACSVVTYPEITELPELPFLETGIFISSIYSPLRRLHITNAIAFIDGLFISVHDYYQASVHALGVSFALSWFIAVFGLYFDPLGEFALISFRALARPTLSLFL